MLFLYFIILDNIRDISQVVSIINGCYWLFGPSIIIDSSGVRSVFTFDKRSASVAEYKSVFCVFEDVFKYSLPKTLFVLTLKSSMKAILNY